VFSGSGGPRPRPVSVPGRPCGKRHHFLMLCCDPTGKPATDQCFLQAQNRENSTFKKLKTGGLFYKYLFFIAYKI
jgi:hypothetical protein